MSETDMANARAPHANTDRTLFATHCGAPRNSATHRSAPRLQLNDDEGDLRQLELAPQTESPVIHVSAAVVADRITALECAVVLAAHGENAVALGRRALNITHSHREPDNSPQRRGAWRLQGAAANVTKQCAGRR